MAIPFLTIKNLNAWYTGERKVLSDFSIELDGHEVVGLIGLNGAGKTTFLKTLSGLHETFCSDGILLYGRTVKFRDRAFKTCRYTVFAEDHSFQYFTFREYFSYVFAVYGKEHADITALVQGFHFEGYTDVLLKDLSTGNKKKAFLITGFALKPELLLLDEPVNGLDFQSTEFLYQLIAGYKEYGTILFSSHILESITLTSDRVLVLENGHIWQTFERGQNNAANMKNLFMLPFGGREFVFSYVSALGAYTFLTKTVGLLAVVLAVSSWNGIEIFGSLLCTVNGVLMTACIYSRKRYRIVGFCWAGVVIATFFLLWDSAVFLPVITSSILLAILFLSGVDAYSFYYTGSMGSQAERSNRRYSVWRYLFRYLMAHKNYLVNTVAMWGVGCVLPIFLGKMEDLSIMPVGFAILSLNTPICILLSCDPALEQAVRFLPGQKRAFFIPYCLFIFLCNMAADAIFLCSLQIQIGGVTGTMILAAVFFALQSAIGSVMLEWFCPVRGWKIENDLWHHPRKYIVPAAMLLIAGVAGTIPVMIPVLIILLIIEVVILLFQCQG